MFTLCYVQPSQRKNIENMFTDTFGVIYMERKRNLIKLSATENKIAIETKLSSLNYISFPVRFYDSQHNVFSISGWSQILITFNLFFMEYPVDFVCITLSMLKVDN